MRGKSGARRDAAPLIFFALTEKNFFIFIVTNADLRDDIDVPRATLRENNLKKIFRKRYKTIYA